MNFTKNFKDNKKAIEDVFVNNLDLISKEFTIANVNACLLHLKGVVKNDSISDYVLRPLKETTKLPKSNVLEYIKNEIILVTEVDESKNILKTCQLISRGKTILLVDGFDSALVIGLDHVIERAVTEPPTSAVSKGPREGFNENIKTNLSTVRKILCTPHLKSVKLEIGKLTKTQVSVVYLDNVADKKIVDKIVTKLKLIKIDGVLESYYIVQHLEERPNSMFKQVGLYEKPDIVCSKLLEGRVAIFVDGSPIVITLPFILIEDIHSADDHYQQPIRVSAIRFIRLISIGLTIILPGLYIALLMFHYRALPLRFLVTILNSSQGLPFMPFAEIIVITILFEILYEASLRMPKYLGLALSVVGALILGDTAVKAGLISPPAVMIVAVSGIAIYTIPEQAAQLSLLRFFFILAGGLLGFYGLMILAIMIVVHLSDFDNYGAPYLSPASPFIRHDLKDSVLQTNITSKKYRPKAIPNKNSKRLRWKKLMHDKQEC